MLITGFIYTLTGFMLVTANFHLTSIRLNDGNKIPPIAFGTFGKVSEIESVGSAVVTAVEAGYRQIDAAYFYKNEGVIGEAISNVIRRGIVKRKELFISTKLSMFSGRDAVVPALKKSLARLKLDYIDLYLIHVPRNQTNGEDYPYVNIWKGMEDAKMLGLTKSIGVSNFNSSNINKILSNCNIRPAVNEIEVNPTMANMGLVAYCQSQNIQVLSYAPFGFAVPRPFNNKTLAPSFNDPTLVKIANKYGKSTSQVFLRYLIDRNTIPVPKSTNSEHIRSNIDVFDFRLTREEVYKISEFDINTAVYLQNGVLPAELFTYIYGASLQEVFDAQKVDPYDNSCLFCGADEILWNYFKVCWNNISRSFLAFHGFAVRVPGPSRCLKRSANNAWDLRPRCRFKGPFYHAHKCSPPLSTLLSLPNQIWNEPTNATFEIRSRNDPMLVQERPRSLSKLLRDFAVIPLTPTSTAYTVAIIH